MTDKISRDSLYAEPRKMIVDFAFDESVASVFPDMIRRSVPGYETVISLIGLLADRYIQSGTNCYDLGCSLGATTLSILSRTQTPCQIIAVDNSPEMIERCEKNLQGNESPISTEVICNDIQNINIKNASFSVLNFTLQFIEPEKRTELLKKICSGTNAGGALVISEKIQFEQTDEQEFHTSLHHDFKRANGYSDLEISQKRTALENVLIMDTLSQHRDRLIQAGFSQVYTWFQCFNFVSLIAIK